MAYQIESLKSLAKKELESGFRLSRVIAKKGKIGNKTMESQGVIIPVIGINVLNTLVNDPIGKEFLINSVAGIQDSIIRKMVENGKLAFYDEQIGFSALITAMQSENESVRFSKDSIQKWFIEIMSPILDEKIAEKYSGIAESKKAAMLNGYLTSFQILAQRQPTMSKEIKAGLIRAMEFLPQDQDDPVTIEIATRLPSVQEPQVLAEML